MYYSPFSSFTLSNFTLFPNQSIMPQWPTIFLCFIFCLSFLFLHYIYNDRESQGGNAKMSVSTTTKSLERKLVRQIQVLDDCRSSDDVLHLVMVHPLKTFTTQWSKLCRLTQDSREEVRLFLGLTVVGTVISQTVDHLHLKLFHLTLLFQSMSHCNTRIYSRGKASGAVGIEKKHIFNVFNKIV